MSERRRWRPPPMNPDGPDSDAERNKVRLDEKVVRKMLQVNPSVRNGRTTFQVKRDLERGEQKTSQASRSPTLDSVTAPQPASQSPSRFGPRSELGETLAFFIRGKSVDLEDGLARIAVRKKALDEEERQLKERAVQQMVSFLAMLEPQVVAMHGVGALSKHKSFLELLGISPTQVLERVRKAKP